MVVGKSGEFAVVVDGEVIARRGGNILSRLFGAGWPDMDEVVRAVEERLARVRE